MNRIFEAIAKGFPAAVGNTYFVSDTTGAFWNDLNLQYPPGKDGNTRVFSTVTLALAACTAGYGEYVVLAPDFTTALTAAEEDSVATKGVTVLWSKNYLGGNKYVTHRATAVLPQAVNANIFTVTGKIKLLNLVGEVTTVTQDQANSLTIVSAPTVGASAAIAAATSVRNNAAGAIWNITGTIANAMVTSVASGISQATPLILPPGTIRLQATAANTGSVKWHVVYEAVDPGARVVVA